MLIHKENLVALVEHRLTEGLIFGGESYPSNKLKQNLEWFSWTEVNDLNTGRQQLSGNGTIRQQL